MAKLCVNVDHVATLRQARMIDYPDPLEAALLAEKSGAVGITIHLREDRRHIQDADVFNIKKNIGTKLNLEMATAKEIVEIALKVKPYQVTFVPEKRKEITTEGGLSVSKRFAHYKKVTQRFIEAGILVSHFVDPDKNEISSARSAGADAVELNTGAYSEAKNKREQKSSLKKLREGALFARSIGLDVHAGHGLNLENVKPVSDIKIFSELNIGHSIIARAVMVGLKKAVKEMIIAIR